jgi:hypothetical protein
MPSDLLVRYDPGVPDVSDDAPICWVEYLKTHGTTGRRIAKAVLELYDGNATKVAKILGVSVPLVLKHIQNPVMRFMLGERKPVMSIEGAIADREERAETLTMLMRNTQVDVKERLRALELLGKMNADYTDKVEVKGEITTLHELVRSLAEEPPPKSGVEYTPHTAPIEVQRDVRHEAERPHDKPMEDLLS